mmetsp:Transcript_1706/g.4340  ORF Transcript_1706/g.4340 Transcript_1706/m.4340 type:complete len:339 (+) Transcript_1706:185-1201(+)
MPSTSSDPTKQSRFGEKSKFLPVAFVVCNILGLYLIYMFYHAVPRLSDPDSRYRATIETTIFNVITALLAWCYVSCILVHPGSVPDREEDASWQYVPQDTKGDGTAVSSLQETKRSGDRRHCKWCAKYKPDRCHHCRVCRMCILKMDHHCPWIYNCVGYFNYKYFFLVIFYSVIALHMIFWTMFESVERSLEDDREPFLTSFLTLFGVTLAASLGFIVTLFGMFHAWLICKGLSTIELFEKQGERRDDATLGELICGDAYTSKFNHGTLQNIRTSLGDWAILWLLPVCPPSGSGLNFVQHAASGAEEEARSMEARRGTYVRRTSHKKRAHQHHRDYWV